MVQGAARSPSWVLRMGFKKNPHYISKKGYIIVLNPSFSRFLFRLNHLPGVFYGVTTICSLRYELS